MTTTTERKTCEQLVDDRLKDRLEDIRKSAGLDPQGKPTFEPLSIDRVTTYKVCLSFVGACGPADFLELDWDGEGWIGGRYIYWLDWIFSKTSFASPNLKDGLGGKTLFRERFPFPAMRAVFRSSSDK